MRTATTPDDTRTDRRPGLMTPAETAAWESLRDEVRITVRPVASPSSVGLFGLAGATLVMSGAQLGWVGGGENRQVALALIGFAFVSQFLASIMAALARDVVVSTAMAVLSLSWLTVGAVMFTSPPGSSSDALGMLLVLSAVAMVLIGITAAMSKIATSLVFITAGIRFLLTALQQITDNKSWKTAAGLTGLVLFALAVYSAWAFLLEGALHKEILPVGRRREGSTATHGGLSEQLLHVHHEAGVRNQL